MHDFREVGAEFGLFVLRVGGFEGFAGDEWEFE